MSSPEVVLSPSTVPEWGALNGMQTIFKREVLTDGVAKSALKLKVFGWENGHSIY
jgi:hypothetical protein